ncbi:MAG: hypothetical protein AAFX06_01830 [Planctomycetota bacterium]
METAAPGVFRQACPLCGSELELPLAADSKLAQCPACEHRFIASRDSEPESVDSGGDAQPDTIEQAVPPSQLRAVPIETIAHRTQAVLSKRSKHLFRASLWPFAILFLFVVIPFFYLNDLYTRNAPLAVIWMWSLSPIYLVLTWYSIWFTFKRSDWACDFDAYTERVQKGKPIPRSLWLPNDVSFLKLGAVSFVLLLCVPVVLSFVASLAANVIEKMFTGQDSLILAQSLAVGFALACAYIWLLTLVWPLFPLALRRGSIKSDVNRALRMTRINRMTSFLVIVLSFLLLGIGFAAFLLLLCATAPCVALLLVVAGRQIEGREIPVLDSVSDEFDQFLT